jgi:molybdenum cofactor guanylyltransferase
MPHSTIQPIVLTGGASRRFGSDKLRASLGSAQQTQWLIDRPIAALRMVFGPHIALVGECHPDVAARGDLVIADKYPGVGPIGGILSALEATGSDVFVLAGDLPNITADAVATIVQAAHSAPHAWAVLATPTSLTTPTSPTSPHAADFPGLRPQPCIGVYRPAVIPLLRQRLQEHRRSLHDLLTGNTAAAGASPTSEARLLLVPLPPAQLVNANTPESLRRSSQR